MTMSFPADAVIERIARAIGLQTDAMIGLADRFA
jgi:hypothetical protein